VVPRNARRGVGGCALLRESDEPAYTSDTAMLKEVQASCFGTKRQKTAYVSVTLGYKSGTCGQGDFLKMPRILILNAERLSEEKPGPTEIHTLGLILWVEKPASKEARKGGWLGLLGGTLDGGPVVSGMQGFWGSSMAKE
jgi:hypothetical protein